MKLKQIIEKLENISSPFFQETYDNCGLLIGNEAWDCSGILCTLDVTEDVVKEAIKNNCNLIVTHHPIIFNSIKKINYHNYIEKCIILAIKNDIAIYAIHTNLDNIITGVNDVIAQKLNLINKRILLPKTNTLKKLFTFVPIAYANKIKSALFEAGAGNIGNYSECSFGVEGIGTFNANTTAKPFIGEIGKQQEEKELKIEVVFPTYLEKNIVTTLLKVHPYEEVAYDIIELSNTNSSVGSGLIGELPEAKDEQLFLHQIKAAFGLQVIKHTELLYKNVKKVAICGGAGSFLIKKALAAEADFFITSDIKYHEFFDAESKMVIADIGHWESEQFTPNLLVEILRVNFPTFAVLKSNVHTNPVRYFI